MTDTFAGYSDIGTDGLHSGTAAAVPVPTGLSTNDLVVVILYVYNPGDANTITKPDSSWTVVTAANLHQNTTDVSTDNWQAYVAYHYYAGESGTYAFSWTNSSLYSALVDVVRNAPPSSPIDTAVTLKTTFSTMPAAVQNWATGLSAAAANEFAIISALGDQGFGFDAGLPTGFTARTASGSFGGKLWDKLLTASGAVGTIQTSAFGAEDQTFTIVLVKPTSAAPVNTGQPVVTGTTVVGSVLTTTDGTWDKTVTTAYQWQHNPGSGYTNISGATANAYTLVSGDAGDTARCVVTATASSLSTSANSTETPAITAASAVPAASTPLPQISGLAVQGSTLTATFGTWTNLPTSWTIQWLRNGSVIPGANNSNYTLIPADVGHTLTVSVVASNVAGPATGPEVSAAFGPIAAGTMSTSAPYVGGTWTVSDGMWQGGAVVPVSFTRKWQRNPGTGFVDIAGATTNTYTTVSADLGCTIRAIVTATDVGGISTPSISAVTGVVQAAPTLISGQPPTIAGAAVQGQTLTATTGGWNWNPSQYAYQWKRDGAAITLNATGNSYTLVSADVGHVITVTVTATNPIGSTPATSAATGSVASSGTSSSPVLTLTGTTITWPAITGATDYKVAINQFARNDPNRTTSATYVDLGAGVTSYSPPASAGQTLYYGVAATVAGVDNWTDTEVSIAWPAGTNKPIISINNPAGWGGATMAKYTSIGVKWAREDIVAGDMTLVDAAIAAGMRVLPVYTHDPGGSGDGNGLGLTTSMVTSDMNTIVPLLLARGINTLEFLNESYLHLSAAQYGALYHAAHVAIAGRLRLLCVATTDFWDTGAGLGGSGNWFNDLKAALPGGVNEVDAWTLHPYTPGVGGSTSMTTVGSDGYGWPAVTSLHQEAITAGFPSTLMWWLTEFGADIKKIQAAGQASITTAALNSILGMPWVAMLNFYQAEDLGTGATDFGYINFTSGVTAGYTALATWMAANAASINEGAAPT